MLIQTICLYFREAQLPCNCFIGPLNGYYTFLTFVQELEKSKPVILTGDLNCAHQEIDIHDPAVSALWFLVVYELLNIFCW